MKKILLTCLIACIVLSLDSCRYDTPPLQEDTVAVEQQPVAVPAEADASVVGCQTEVRKPDRVVRVRKGNTLYIETEGMQLLAVDTAVKHAGVYSVTSLMSEEVPPLPQGMMNMTAAASGYRLLPSGEHFSPYAELRMAYDPGRLPMGYTPDDIYTSYYDTAALAWVRLERVGVDTVTHEIVSLTTHFTDFVNELLKAPEMPETQAFVPTAMTDLEAVNPLDGLPIVQPPTANNNGTANITYPIDIPAGRGGMQPNLALTYSSTGGGGWLGVGWDIPVSSITLDTRWGVPRYDPKYETEIYLLDGEQLITKNADGEPRPMPHRTNNQTFRANLGDTVQFYARTGDAHDSIIRHGDNPRKYWWEVVDRNGVTHYYGHYVDSSRNVVFKGLCDDVGNIARWPLCESRDLYGNTVRYYYTLDNVNKGRQLYLDSISYTGHDSVDGLYTLVFCRSVNTTTDIPVVCNNGFKEITAQILCNLRLKEGNNVVAAWVFEMENGYRSNFRNRLTAVTKIDSARDGIKQYLSELCLCIGESGTEPPSLLPDSGYVVGADSLNQDQWETDSGYGSINNTHPINQFFNGLGGVCAGTTTRFNYYDAPSPDSLFGVSVNSSLTSHHLRGRLRSSEFCRLPYAEATALGLSHSSSKHIGGTAAVGVNSEVWNTTFAGGGNYTHTTSASEALMTLIDLDGDGLADKVFVAQDGMYFCRRVSAADSTIVFGPPQKIRGASHFLCENSSSHSFGVQLSMIIGGNANWTLSQSLTSTYFADVNGDGLPDIVNDGQVLFNYLGIDSVPRFIEYIPGKKAIEEEDWYDSIIIPATQCGDIIFDGEINDSITCRSVLELYRTIKGINQIPDIEDTIASYQSDGYITEVDGDSTLYIYQQTWDCSPIDDGIPNTEVVRVWVAPREGPVNIISTTSFLEDTSEARHAARHTDGVTLAIQHNQSLPFIHGMPPLATLLDTHYFCDTCYSNYTYQQTRQVRQGDILFFRLRSHDDRQFDNVVTHQQIIYQKVSQDTFDSRRDFVLSSDYYFQAPRAGYYSISGTFHDPDSAFEWRLTTPYMSNYSRGSNINDYGYLNEGDTVHCLVRPLNISFQPWGNMRCQPYLTFVPDVDSLDTLRVTDTMRMYLPVKMETNSTNSPFYRRLFGPLYHGWGQFAYHSLDTGYASRLILIDSLIPPDVIVPGADSNTIANSIPSSIGTTTTFDTTAFATASSLEEFQRNNNFYNPLSYSSRWVEMTPDFERWRWVGYGDVGYLGRDTMSNTLYERWNPITLSDTDSVPPLVITPVSDDPVPAPRNGVGARAMRKFNVTFSHNSSTSIAFIGSSNSDGFNMIFTDYLDLNGDRYPDNIGIGGVQYSTQCGGLGSLQNPCLNYIPFWGSTTESHGNSFSVSSNFPQRTLSGSQGDAKFTLQGDGSFNASGNIGHDTAMSSWIDINGDGLLDYVTKNGRVYLNKGYSFQNDGNWRINNIHSGVSGSFGIDLGLGLTGDALSAWQASIQAGAGISVSANQNTVTLIDINGDGLPDRLWRMYDNLDTNESPVCTKVSFNLGNGRWSENMMLNINRFNYSTSYNESVNLGLTLGLPVWKLKVTGGLRGSPYSCSVNRDRVQLVDINADGLPDLVSSNSENAITVRYHQGGRTNLLRSVTNFTGSEISIEYTLSEPCREQPSRNWLMTCVATHDPLNPVGGQRSVTRYTYEKPYYDRYERTSYGYGIVYTNQINTEDGDRVYRIIERDYYNNSLLKRGRLKRELTMDGDSNKYIERLYDYVHFDLNEDIVDICQPQVFYTREGTLTRYYEGQTQPQFATEERTLYDRYHNIIKYTDYGDTASNTDGVTVTVDYLTGQPHNLIGLRSSYSVYPMGSSTHVRHATFEYNDHGKQARQTLHNTNDSSVYDFVYEPTFGNLDSAIQPLNDSNQRMAYHYEYDNTVHTYPTQIVNSHGETMRTTYNYRFGKPLTVTDPANNTMQYTYDFAGRLASVRSPLNTSGTPSLVNFYHPVNYYHNGLNPLGYTFNPSPTDHPYAVTRHYDDSGDSITETVVITDGFGRVIQTKKGLTVNGAEVMQVSGRTEVDAFGRTVKQYDPVLESISTHRGRYNVNYDTASRTTMTYDVLDRVTKTAQPLGITTFTAYDIGNDQGGHRRFVTTTTDPNGGVTVQYADYEGRPVQVTDTNGGITTMHYDNLGQLEYSVDPDNFYTYYGYDNLGRLVSREHPDAGITEYSYDPAGNLTREENPLGEINYGYKYNRLIHKRYNNMTGNDVTYTYDNAGRLNEVLDGSGRQRLTYDALGNVIAEERTLAVPGNAYSYTFNMEYHYDSWGRMLSMTYPDGEEVTYDYLWGGDLGTVTGHKGSQQYRYIKSVAYNAMGQRSSIAYGNGTSAHYGYDALHRLDSLECIDSNGIAIQKIKYTFDSCSNITHVTDNGTQVNGLGGGYSNSYIYDPLHRLILSNGSGVAATYGTELQYTNAGRLVNILEEVNGEPSDRWYGYCDEDKPHAPRRIWDAGTMRMHDLRWDDAGNLTQRTTFDEQKGDISSRFLFWTEDSRLHTVADEKYYSYYVYDHQGNRTVKMTGGSSIMDINADKMSTTSMLDEVTLYPSPYLVVTEKGYTKHYYAGADRLAARLGCGDLCHIDYDDELFGKVDELFTQSLAAVAHNSTTPNDDNCVLSPLLDKAPSEIMEMVLDDIPQTLDALVKWDLEGFIAAMLQMAESCEQGSVFTDPPSLTQPGWSETEEVYFYHSDHLGSASWITNGNGEAIQHLQYMPFGAPLVNQRAAGYNERFTFTGKEKDEETGFGYFGARYMDHELMTMWLSVDPLADKYPGISPYNYCMWNPVKLVDPDGREIGDYYNFNGVYLGWDGNNDDNIYIIGNKSDVNRIKNNDKEGRTTSVDDLQSEPLLKTTYGVLREACDVLERAERNSGQTKEECSVVDYKSGLGVRSSTGESRTTKLPQTPDWVIAAVSIHSHNKFNDATQMSGHHEEYDGDADHFGDFIQNVIVGPLGVGGLSGLCFYPRTSDKTIPSFTMQRTVADKIIRQQHIRTQREINKIIQNL